MCNPMVKCRICGKWFDPAEGGDGVSDDHGNWAHEGCQDAEDEAAANALDEDRPDCAN